ncbi:Exportin-6 [Chytriomyces hyalinus]|nr:Exportin-6 [Chytriomyces hyalinus]
MFVARQWNIFEDIFSIDETIMRLSLTERVVAEFVALSSLSPSVSGSVANSLSISGNMFQWAVPIISDSLGVLACTSSTSFPALGVSPSRTEQAISPKTVSLPASIDPACASLALRILTLLIPRIPIPTDVLASSSPTTTSSPTSAASSYFYESLSAFGAYASQCADLSVAGEALTALSDVCTFKTMVDTASVSRFINSLGNSGVLCALRRACEHSNSIDEQYASKLIHLLSVFLRNHLQRAESVGGFPADEFLQLLFKFTFVQESPESFVDCVQLWEIFVDFCHAQQLKGGEGSVRRYREGLVTLSSCVIPALLYSQNSTYLSLLSFEKEDGGTESEWSSFSNACLGLIAKISDLFPSEIVQHVIAIFMANGSSLQQAQNQSKLNAACRDLSTMSRLMGQIAHFLCNVGEIEASLTETTAIVERLLELLRFALSGGNASNSVRNELCVDLFASLRMYIHWLEQYYALANSKSDQYLHNFSILLNSILEVSVSSLLSKDPAISMEASTLLLSIAKTVRPNIVAFPAMGPLLTNAHAVARKVATGETKRNVYKVVTLAIVVPVNSTKVLEEEWNARLSRLTEFFSSLVLGFQSMWNVEGRYIVNPQDPDVRNEVRHLLDAFSAAMSAVNAEAANPKNVVYLSIKPVISLALSLFEVFAHDSEMLLDLFDFTLALQVSLKRQSSRENGTLVVETLQLFMKMVESKGLLQLAASNGNLANNHSSNATLQNGSSEQHQLHLLDKFLQFLKVMVQDTAKSIEGLLNDIFVFCQYSYKFIAHEDSANETLKLHFYDLLFTLLTYHQRYYFGSTVSRSASMHEREVAGMLEMVANSFSDRNMEVFRHNLAGLNSLNTKCALYLKEFFQKHMMVPFIDLFLGLLILKGHDFMREDIIDTLSKITSCNVSFFRQEYVPHFMSKYCAGLLSQDQATLFHCINSIEDTSNAPQLISSLVSDLIYFQQ